VDSVRVIASILCPALTVVTLCYVAMCAAWPFGACRRCDGGGKLRNPLARRMSRLCPRCDGTGRRVRIGRRIYEYARREHTRGAK
jgi:hypothetical protein